VNPDVTCDLCNANTSREEATAYSADEFRKLACNGFEPADQILKPMLLTGLSADEACRQWKHDLVANSTSNWLLCPACAARAAPFLAKNSSNDTATGNIAESTSREMLKPADYEESNTKNNGENIVAKAEREDRWVAAMENLPSQITQKRFFGSVAMAVTLGLIVFAMFGATEAESNMLLINLSLITLMTATLFFTWASHKQRRGIFQLAQEITQACENDNLSRHDLVEALAKRVRSGRIRHEVLAAIDQETTTLLEIRERAKEFFKNPVQRQIAPTAIHATINPSDGVLSSITVEGEFYALTFCSMTLSYLEQQAYIEALAALGMASSIYSQIAPPTLRGTIEARFSGDDFKCKLTKATYDIFCQFEFESEFKVINGARERRRHQPLIDLFATTRDHKQLNTLTRLRKAQAEGIAETAIRDKQFVSMCIDYLSSQTGDNRFQSIEALAQIPARETLPHLLQATSEFPFLPHAVDALIRLGKTTEPRLLETFKNTQSTNSRFNLALALGFMKLEGARIIFEDLLSNANQPVERIGCAFGMVQLGETDWLDEIQQSIEHNDPNVRLAAAIALEHLPQPVSDNTFLKGLNDINHLVRLRMTRKLLSQGTENPAVVEALVFRFDDSNDLVRSLAIEAAGATDTDVVFDILLRTSRHGHPEARACAIRALGKLGAPHTIPVLMTQLAESSPTIKEAALSALGDAKALSTVGVITDYLPHEALGDTAMWALVKLGKEAPEAVTKAIEQRNSAYYEEERSFFVLATLGNEQARTWLAERLQHPQSMELTKLIELLNYALVLHDARFSNNLRRCLTFNRIANYPGERYVPHLAFKALVHSLI
jgi:HEAT repeat protein